MYIIYVDINHIYAASSPGLSVICWRTLLLKLTEVKELIFLFLLNCNSCQSSTAFLLPMPSKQHVTCLTTLRSMIPDLSIACPVGRVPDNCLAYCRNMVCRNFCTIDTRRPLMYDSDSCLGVS